MSSEGPEEKDRWFELDPDVQQQVRDTWDPDDLSPLDEFLDPSEYDLEDEDEEDEAA